MAGRALRIADFSTHLSGPMASHLLHEAGAEVIKIENPRVGDGNRGVEPLIQTQGNLHVGVSAGARSLAVDIRSPLFSTVVAACARWADGVIVGGRLDDTRARGLDFARFAEANDRIVYCLITGYGMTGPWAGYTAHGQNPDSLAGRVDVQWHDGQPRARSGWRSTGSTLAGVFAALGILAALNRQVRGDDGPQFVHTSLWAAAMWWGWRDVNTEANLGQPWSEYANLGSRYSTYATSDGRALIICPIERKFWHAFCDVAELPDALRDRGDWSKGAEFGFDDERSVIADAIQRQTLDAWVERLSFASIPFAPVLTVAEALGSDHAAANGVLRDTTVDGRRARIAATPVRIGDGESAGTAPPADLASPPGIGEHTDEILHELGLDLDADALLHHG